MSIGSHLKMHRARVLLVAALALGMLAAPGSAAALPPSNDNFSEATVIAGLPLTATVGVTEATTEAGEPLTWWGQSRTVWWAFTPQTDTLIRRGISCCNFLSVFRADAPGFAGLTRISSTGSGPYGTTYSLTAGATYYFQAGDDYPYGWTTSVYLSLEEVLPPPNDDFDDAVEFASVPFTNSVDPTAATLEPGEPLACPGNSTGPTVWYAFTPTTSGSYGQFGTSSIGVYTGSSLGSLTSVACSDWPGLYFYAEAGTTYYLQATNGGVSLDVVPPPDPGWSFSPGDPSRLDEITFRQGYGYWDPTITDYAWDFGDGTSTTSSQNPVTHRYATDGDYVVTLTLSARGNRTASQTQTVSVRTHDIGIRWSSVTARGRVGRATPVQVGIGNTRYPETVRVDYYKLTPAGEIFLGAVAKAVPVLGKQKTVVFALNYTFTEEDLAFGKVSFRALATIEGARDAFGADNAVTTTPTIVTR